MIRSIEIHGTVVVRAESPDGLRAEERLVEVREGLDGGLVGITRLLPTYWERRTTRCTKWTHPLYAPEAEARLLSDDEARSRAVAEVREALAQISG